MNEVETVKEITTNCILEWAVDMEIPKTTAPWVPRWLCEPGVRRECWVEDGHIFLHSYYSVRANWESHLVYSPPWLWHGLRKTDMFLSSNRVLSSLVVLLQFVLVIDCESCYSSGLHFCQVLLSTMQQSSTEAAGVGSQDWSLNVLRVRWCIGRIHASKVSKSNDDRGN